MNRSYAYYTFVYALVFVITLVLWGLAMAALGSIRPDWLLVLLKPWGTFPATGLVIVATILYIPLFKTVKSFTKHENRAVETPENWGLAFWLICAVLILTNLTHCVFLVGTGEGLTFTSVFGEGPNAIRQRLMSYGIFALIFFVLFGFDFRRLSKNYFDKTQADDIFS